MKKQLLTALALLLSASSFAQNTGYTLTIKLSALKMPAKAYLVSRYGWSDSKVIDSANFQNGKFIFKGNTPEPVKTHIVINHSGKGRADWNAKNDVLQVYVAPGNIVVSGADSVTHASISGSKLSAEYVRYRAEVLSSTEKASKEANAAFALASADQKKDKNYTASLLLNLRAAMKVTDSLKYVYINKNPNSFLSLEALDELAGKDPDVVKIDPVFKKLSADVRGTKTGQALAKRLEDGIPTSVGALALEFTQNDVNGNPVKLSDFRGKYVLLDFWASWCGPCRRENPNVIKAYEKYKDKNFTVLGVSLDQASTKEAWLAAIKADGLVWTQVSDLQAWNNAVAKLYRIRSIPQNFLIDPSGKIVAKNLRENALSEKLATLLN